MANRRSIKQQLISILILLFSVPAIAGFFTDDYQLLPEDQAFIVDAQIVSSDKLIVNWVVAPDYYMYREQFRVESTQLVLGDIQFSKGEIEDDPEFGKVEVYFDVADLVVPITKLPEGLKQLQFTLKGQGCNKPVGICYPPQTRELLIDVPEFSQEQQSAPIETDISNQVTEQQDKSFWSYLLAAFGAGILLSFTPCVLPMIPILSGVIAGQNQPSKMQSGWLAVCYVLGTVVTYAIAGGLAGATGAQLQAYFQNPWAIGTICAILLFLAISLFGAFEIQMPSSIQTRIQNAGGKSSSSITSFILGLLSALIVGACVSPILILALGAAITKGDPVLGAGIMASMALGMGLLLILFGFGAGWILPKAGAWMERIKQLFGFMVLGVAIYLLGVLPDVPVLFLWALLLLVVGFFLWHIATEADGDAKGALIISSLRALAVIALLWGATSFIGALNGNQDVLRPLHGFAAGKSVEQNKLPFVSVANKQQLDDVLLSAQQNSRPVLIDFYADWCIDCVRMQRTTFVDQQVHQALNEWILVKVDVTDPQGPNEEIKKAYGVFGPPAMLFIGNDGVEQKDDRRYGYMNAKEFLQHIAAF